MSIHIEASVDSVFENFPTDIKNGVVSFANSRDELLKVATAFLQKHLARINEMNAEGAEGRLVVQELTAVFDQLITVLFKAVCADLDPQGVAGCSLIALGGYGRAEMNPRSDLLPHPASWQPNDRKKLIEGLIKLNT